MMAFLVDKGIDKQNNTFENDNALHAKILSL